MKKYFEVTAVITFLIGFLIIAVDCATIQKGQDQLVVETERVLTVGKGTLELVTAVDEANRMYWETNAPAFHQFVEWLRTKVTFNETNIMRRGPAILMSLESVKIQYKQHKASSNAVYTALATAQSAVNEAQTWLATINTNTVTK